MTQGYLSKLERDQVSASVASLVAVCAAPLGRARGIRPLYRVDMAACLMPSSLPVMSVPAVLP